MPTARHVLSDLMATEQLGTPVVSDRILVRDKVAAVRTAQRTSHQCDALSPH